MTVSIILGVLLFWGNLSFSLESSPSSSHSECQKFVSLIFEYHKLPLPFTNEFPLDEGFGFDLIRYDNSQPEFDVKTQPIKKSIETPSGSVKFPPFVSEGWEHSYRFKAQILKDRRYKFEVHYIMMRPKTAELRFMRRSSAYYFSNECKFQGYEREIHPPSWSGDFSVVSGDSNCHLKIEEDSITQVTDKDLELCSLALKQNL